MAGPSGPRSARLSWAPTRPDGTGSTQPAEHGRGQVGEHDQSGLAGRAGGQQPGAEPGAVGQGQLQVRRAGGRPGRGDQQHGAGRELGHDALQFGVRGGERGGSPGRRESAQVDDGQRAAGQDGRGHPRRGGQVEADVAGRAGQGQRGAGADGGRAARGAAEQAPVRAGVELLVARRPARAGWARWRPGRPGPRRGTSRSRLRGGRMTRRRPRSGSASRRPGRSAARCKPKATPPSPGRPAATGWAWWPATRRSTAARTGGHDHVPGGGAWTGWAWAWAQ